MTEKNRIPAIRFKGFSKDWSNRSFSETFSNVSNNTLSRSELNYKSGLAKNIHYGDVLINFSELLDTEKDEIPFITDNFLANKYKSSQLQNGDIVIADAAEDETVGKCTEIMNVGNQIITSGLHTIPVRPTLLFASKYLGYYMNSHAFHNQLLRLMQGTKVLSISKSAIKDTSVVFPDETVEQTQIGSYFQNLDKLISLRQAKYNKLLNLKKAMFEKMFPKNGTELPEIRFKGFKGNWEGKELGKIGNTFTGLSGKTKDDFGHGMGKFITYMNVFSNPISNRRMVEPVEIDNKQNAVQFGDVFFTTSSETAEEVGMSSVWLETSDNTYLNSFCFGYRLTEKLDSYYLAYLLRSPSIRKKIAFLAQGISRYNISKNKVMEIKIPIPDVSEQEKIGAYFQNLDKLITLHQSELEKLNNLKKACLEKMFV